MWYVSVCLVTKSCPTVCNPMDSSRPGSSVHGLLQARILEWVAISFSRDLLDSGIEPTSHVSPALQADSLPKVHKIKFTNLNVPCDECWQMHTSMYLPPQPKYRTVPSFKKFSQALYSLHPPIEMLRFQLECSIHRKAVFIYLFLSLKPVFSQFNMNVNHQEELLTGRFGWGQRPLFS